MVSTVEDVVSCVLQVRGCVGDGWVEEAVVERAAAEIRVVRCNARSNSRHPADVLPSLQVNILGTMARALKNCMIARNLFK